MYRCQTNICFHLHSLVGNKYECITFYHQTHESHYVLCKITHIPVVIVDVCMCFALMQACNQFYYETSTDHFQRFGPISLQSVSQKFSKKSKCYATSFPMCVLFQQRDTNLHGNDLIFLSVTIHVKFKANIAIASTLCLLQILHVNQVTNGKCLIIIVRYTMTKQVPQRIEQVV